MKRNANQHYNLELGRCWNLSNDNVRIYRARPFNDNTKPRGSNDELASRDRIPGLGTPPSVGGRVRWKTG